MSDVLVKTENVLQNAVNYILQYYAVFHYPLSISEIQASCPVKCTKAQILSSLNELVLQRKIYEHNGFFSKSSNIEEQIERRINGNNLARAKAMGAKRAGRLISYFPYVEFVGISGSISKNYAEKNSDYDFFIITKPNRLWLCRTILHLFKKLTFVFGQQSKFCMNYFIDAAALELEEKNQYTAIELMSMIPIENSVVYRDFILANKWAFNFLPNQNVPYNISSRNASGIRVKILLEKSIDLFTNAEKLNKWFMYFTDRRWRKKWKKRNYPPEDYELAFKTRINVSKNHPANHQKKVLEHLSHIRPKL